MTRTLEAFASLDPAVRLLLVSFGLFNLAFYMLLPFLAMHLHGTIGLAAWAVGLLMGLRTFSQQGLYLIGGSLADRLGHRKVLLIGCALRAAGFAMLAFVESLPLLAFAILISGFAAALYAPAGQAMLVELVKEENRTQVFAFASVFRAAGELSGPVVGLLLLSSGFHVVGLTSALVFAGLLILIQRAVPASVNRASGRESMTDSWRTIAAQPHFMSFTFAMSAYFILVSQISLVLPLELQRTSGNETAVAWLFTSCAVVGVALQLPVTQYVSQRFRRSQGIGLGFAGMAAAFIPLLLPPLATPSEPAWLAAMPAIASGILLTIASLAIHPPMMASLVEFSPTRFRATAFGLFYCVCALLVVVSNVVVSAVFALLTEQGSAVALWAGLACVAMLAAVSVFAGIVRTEAVPAASVEAP